MLCTHRVVAYVCSPARALRHCDLVCTRPNPLDGFLARQGANQPRVSHSTHAASSRPWLSANAAAPSPSPPEPCGHYQAARRRLQCRGGRVAGGGQVCAASPAGGACRCSRRRLRREGASRAARRARRPRGGGAARLQPSRPGRGGGGVARRQPHQGSGPGDGAARLHPRRHGDGDAGGSHVFVVARGNHSASYDVAADGEGAEAAPAFLEEGQNLPRHRRWLT
jgi:hypothetical protein